MPAILLVILLALNLLALASILGWLGENQSSGEPQRLAQQLNPERIVLAGEGKPAAADEEDLATLATVLEAATNSEAVAALQADRDRDSDADENERTDEHAVSAAKPAVCLAWSGLNAAQAEHLDAALSRLGAETSRRSESTPGSWWVHIPPLANREQAERQAQNLRQRGVKDLFIVQDAGPNQHAISLGVFKTEARARVMLDQVRKQGIREARLGPRLSSSHHLEARFAASTEAAIDEASRPFNAQRSRCSPE